MLQEVIKIFYAIRKFLGIVQYSDSNGLNVAGTSIDYETVTLAEFQDAGFDLTVERTVYVSNVPADRSLQGGSFWRIVPTATVKRKLISEAVCYSTFAAAIAAFPIASYTGLAYRCGDVGDYNVRLISNGTRVKPESGVALLYSSPSFGTLAAPETTDDSEAPSGVTSHTYTNISKLIPASLFAAGDSLEVIAWFRKGGSAGAFTPVYSVGTNNVIASDSSFYDIAAGSPAVDIEPHGRIKFLTTTQAIAKRANDVEATTGSASRLIDRSAGINLASNMYVNIGIGSKNTSDTVYLVAYDIMWKAV